MDKEKELRETLLEIYRVKVCPLCKSFDNCEPSKSFFEVKVFEDRNKEKVLDYKCKNYKFK